VSGGDGPDDEQAEAVAAIAAGAARVVPERSGEPVTRLLKLATCMRTHGEPNFPDPTVSSAPAGANTVSLPGNITLGLGSAGVDINRGSSRPRSVPAGR